jgi:branched-chain amino acid transport system ATP-binding protein
MLLKVTNITVHYGKAIALDGVSLEVLEGSVVSLVGANGGGKSTVLRAISGLVPLTSGEILFGDSRIDGMAVRDIVRLGLVQVPEGRRLFPFLTVFANLRLGASLRNDKAGIREDMDVVFEHFPRLKERLNQQAGTLSGGEQQMLAIGRGLMARPKLLLLDEPSLGLAPKLVEELGPVISHICERGISVLLVEQNIPLAMSVSSRGYALRVGSVVLEGGIEDFAASDIVRAAYLGK